MWMLHTYLRAWSAVVCPLSGHVCRVQVPEGVDPVALVNHAMSNYNLEIAGGLGPSAGKVYCNRLDLSACEDLHLDVAM